MVKQDGTWHLCFFTQRRGQGVPAPLPICVEGRLVRPGHTNPTLCSRYVALTVTVHSGWYCQGARSTRSSSPCPPLPHRLALRDASSAFDMYTAVVTRIPASGTVTSAGSVFCLAPSRCTPWMRPPCSNAGALPDHRSACVREVTATPACILSIRSVF